MPPRSYLFFGALLSAVFFPPTSSTSCRCLEDKVDCSGRGKTEIDIEELCLNVTKIELSHNDFSSFPNGLQTYLMVYIRENKITRLPDASKLNPEIQTLNIADNVIASTSNELQTLSQLVSLNIRRNKISSLEFLPDPCKLEYLYASDNAVTSLVALSRCKSLISLDLEHNSIKDVPSGVLEGMSQLVTLDLDNNPLETVASGAFQNLPSLRLLFLSKGRLKVLSDGVFSSTPKLEVLYLSQNQLQSLPENVFSGLHSLRDVSLRDNQITELPALQNCCTQLEEANFNWNLISAPSEETVRSYLRGNTTLKIRGALNPSAFGWTLCANDIHVTVADNDCSCGELRGQGVAHVEFCVQMDCEAVTNWKQAARSETGDCV